MAGPLEEAVVLVPSSEERSLFVANNLSVKSGATFQNAALDAVSEPDGDPDDEKWADPHSATKSLSHPTEGSLDDDDKNEEERAAGPSLQITLNRPQDGSYENAKAPHFFETRADDESKEIEFTGFQRSQSCPDNESLDVYVTPIKRSHSHPSTFENVHVGIEQEQERLGSRLSKARQASHLGPSYSDEGTLNSLKLKSSSLYGLNQNFGHLQETSMLKATNKVESAQLNKPEPCYINGDDVSNEAGLHDVAEEVHKLSLEKVPREVEESSLRTAPVLHGQCMDNDTGKSYFDGFHDQRYAGIFPKSFLQSYFNEQRYASILAKSILPSVYYFDGFRDMDQYRKFCPFYWIYFVSQEVQTIDFEAMKEISRNGVYSYGKFRIEKTEYDKERLNTIYPLNSPNIDRLLAVVLEDPNSSNMCYQVTEEPTGTLDSVLLGIGASDDGLLRFITKMCPRDRRNIACNFLSCFKDVLLAGKYLMSSGLCHKAITRKDILVIQKCECLNFLFCDCFVATSERKWIASLSESMCIIRHSDDILCLSNSTNNSTGAAALIEQRTSDGIDSESNFKSTCELYLDMLFGRNRLRAFNVLTVDVFEQDVYMRCLRRLGVELLESDRNTQRRHDYFITFIEEV